MEYDIDQFLEGSSQTVTYSSSQQSTMSSSLGRFSKAVFVASTEGVDGQDVDLDDPDFWGNCIGLEAPHESFGEDGMKLLFEKIIHKQLEVYDKYAEFYEVCPEPNILLLSGGKALNDIIRSF